MKTITINTSSIKKLLRHINYYLTKGFQPSLAFIYASSNFNIPKLGKKLSQYDFLIMGATTAGEVYANEEDGVNEVEGSIVCMLMEVNPKALDMTVLEIENDEDAYIIGEHIGLWGKSCFSDCAMITMTSGLAFDSDAYTQGILSKGIGYIFGGMAGDDMNLQETFVFSHNLVSSHGIIALALDREIIDVVGSRAFGWDGIGKERIVTKSIKNVVYEIDDTPAIEFYNNYLEATSADMPRVGLDYPLEVRRRNGEVFYRAILDINEEDGSLIFAGHVEENAYVKLSVPRGKSIIDEVEKSTKKALDARPDFTPEVALVFPCCSRKQVLRHLTYMEIEAVVKNANVPLIGFFVYGEIGAFPDGGSGYHNETFVTLFLSEKVA